jgi:hypothetical protein
MSVPLPNIRAPCAWMLAIAFSDSRPEMMARNDTKYGLIGASPPSRDGSASTGTPAFATIKMTRAVMAPTVTR